MPDMDQGYGNLTQFGGYEIVQWWPGRPLGDPTRQIHRLSCEYDGKLRWADLLGAYLALPGVENMPGLVVGYWGTDTLIDEDCSAMVVEPLRSAAGKLGSLRALFINDISSEESEVSWIPNANLSPLVHAFPELRDLGIRGGQGLELPDLHLPALHSLEIQAGGVSGELVRQIAQATLPELRHLELYLGTEDYGATSSAEDLTPILDGARFPNLRYLGLKNSDYQDELAQLLVSAPVTAHLEVLDLSMGVLTDEGAQALLDLPPLPHLKKLDLAFNWLSEEMEARLSSWARERGVDLDVTDRQSLDDDWRYVALGE